MANFANGCAAFAGVCLPPAGEFLLPRRRRFSALVKKRAPTAKIREAQFCGLSYKVLDQLIGAIPGQNSSVEICVMRHHARSPKELLHEVRQLVADAEKLLSRSASKHSREALETLHERYDAAQEKLAELYDGAKGRVADGARSTEKVIRKHPFQSLVIAICGGVVLGVLLGPCRSRSRRSR